MRVLCAFPEAMPSSNSRPPACLAPVALILALLLHLSLSSQAGDRRPLPVDRAPGLKEKTLILLDVSTKNPVRTVNENFLSLQLDPSIIHDGWLDFLSSKRLVTLARGLSPAFLRFGGKRTDFLQFQNLRNLAKSRGGPGPDYYLKNYEDGLLVGWVHHGSKEVSFKIPWACLACQSHGLGS
uniref:Heparanase 2 (inactive) n=1 Tax=Monodon monoceros TaxID=40151 RepID=A0A8C6FEB9_MONMO